MTWLVSENATQRLPSKSSTPAAADDLAPPALGGYAHFTAIQVRGGGVRGLDLHLDRLRSASLDLFGRAMPDARVRACLRAAIDAGPADLAALSGGAVMNSWTPGVAVRRIGDATMPDAPRFIALLHRAFDDEPLVSP